MLDYSLECFCSPLNKNLKWSFYRRWKNKDYVVVLTSVAFIDGGLIFPAVLGTDFIPHEKRLQGTGAGQITIVNRNSSVQMRISCKAASYSAHLTSRTYRIRKSKGDSSEPGSKTGLKKLRIELNDLTFSLRNPLPLVPILSKSLKCNSPKTVVNKKAKSSRMTCLFR